MMVLGRPVRVLAGSSADLADQAAEAGRGDGPGNGEAGCVQRRRPTTICTACWMPSGSVSAASSSATTPGSRWAACWSLQGLPWASRASARRSTCWSCSTATHGFCKDYRWLEENVGRLVPMEIVIRFREGSRVRSDLQRPDDQSVCDCGTDGNCIAGPIGAGGSVWREG